ncbi:MAG: ISNCY family transposase [Dehalococcoidia bacterium]|nr:ISNCY family transposase [Dehalococcoidia bacterium]
MNRTSWLQETRLMRFEEVYGNWRKRRLTQEEAALILGVSERTFRRYIDRYEEDGLEGLVDKRITQISHRRAPVDEVMALLELYKSRHQGWNACHFHDWYVRQGGKRSYTWVKNRLQEAKLIPQARRKGTHRKRREPSALPGMMIHQDASRHEWVPGQEWDLVSTMDDATNEHYSLFFCAEEGTRSSFQGVKETIEKRGLFCSFYSDRGSHYWHTPEAGGKVDKSNPTQFGRAMAHLGITMIPAYSPEARGRSERAFATHQERLVKELAMMGITTMEEANRYIRETYLPAFNRKFAHPAREEGSAFMAYIGPDLDDILCEQYDRTVQHDNCVRFENLVLQIPKDEYRCNYIKAKVRVHRYLDGSLAIFHGPRKLASYDTKGKITQAKQQAA